MGRGGPPLMHFSSLDQPYGPWLGGIWGVPPRGRRDPDSPSTKKNAMSTWFPLTPENFFFSSFLDWVFHSSAGEEEKRRLWRVRGWTKAGSLRGGRKKKEGAKCSGFFLLFNPFPA